MKLASARRREHERLRSFGRRWLRTPARARGCPSSHESAGFTLIETLAAFTVLTLVLVVLLGELSAVVRGNRDAETMREALRLARSKLDGLGVVEPLAPGESIGRFGNGFEWRLQVRDAQKGTDASLMGVWAEVTVSAPADGTRVPPAVSLVTLKLVRVPRR
jgi:general secretion pathway protein I